MKNRATLRASLPAPDGFGPAPKEPCAAVAAPSPAGRRVRVGGGPASTLALAAWLLAWGLAAPLPARAQGDSPPPVHSFGLDQSQPTASGEPASEDDLVLMDFFMEAADGVTPAVSHPPLPPAVDTAAPPPANTPAAEAGGGLTVPLEVPPSFSSPVTSEVNASAPSVSGPVASPPAAPEPSASAPSVSGPVTPSPFDSEGSASAPFVSGPVAPSPFVPEASASTPSVSGPVAPPPVASEADAPPPAVFAPAFPPAAASTPADPFAAPGGTPMAPTETGAGEVSVPLGQNHPLPQPQWETATGASDLGSAHILSGQPLPQFDSTQSPWIQLDIGQDDEVGPAPATPRPTSVYSVPAPPPEPEEAPAADPVVDQALDRAIQEPPAGARYREPAERERLRQLFSDVPRLESLGARPPVGSGAAPAAAPPAASSSTSGPMVVNVPPAVPPGPAGEEEEPSAILKAGGLLATEGRFGAAEILPPLSGRVDWRADSGPAKAEPAQAAPVKTGPARMETPPPAPVVEPVPAQAVPAAPEKAKPASKAAKSAPGQAKPPAPAKAASGGRTTLAIVNGTGQGRVGEQYRSVLSQMGYQVVSVSQASAGSGPAGRTVVSYRPGLKAKAQALARHLPGRTVLVETKKGQASEIVVQLY